MIEFLPESHGNVLGVKAVGKVTDKDYKEVLIPKVDRMLAKYEKGRFLYYLSEEFEGFEFGAMWDDMKYAAGHNAKFDKVALVGGPKWVDWSVKISQHFMKAEIRTFSADELTQAWGWVEE
jgi:hypothetical protein